MTIESGNGWAIVIGAIGLVIIQVITLVLGWHAKKQADKNAVVLADKSDRNSEKLDTLKTQSDGVQDKLIAVTSRAAFQDGVAAQKVVQNAEEGQMRRIEDIK